MGRRSSKTLVANPPRTTSHAGDRTRRLDHLRPRGWTRSKERGANDVSSCCIFTFVFAGRSDNTYCISNFSSQSFLVDAISSSASTAALPPRVGQRLSPSSAARAWVARAMSPPASSTGGSSYGDVDVLSPAGLDALKTRLGARPRPSPSVFETLRGSSALGRHPLTSSAPPSLAPIPPEHDDWRARVDGMRALTAALEPPPAPDPDAHPPAAGADRRRRRARRFPRGDPRRGRPGRVRGRVRRRPSSPAPSEPRRSRPVPPQVRASPRGPARAPPRRRRRRRVRIRLRARRSRRRGPVPPPPRLPALRRRLRTPAPPSDVSRGRPRERRPRPHGDDAMRRRVARTEPRAAINERARGSRTRVSRANARASRRPSRARARRLASRESHDVSRGHRTRDADVCLGRIGGRATRSARVFRRLRRDVAETRRTRRRNGVAEGETTPPRGRPRSSGGERAMGQRRTRRAGRFQPRRARTRSRPRRRPRRRERVGRCGCGVTDADVSRGGGVARAHRGVGARGVGARPRGGRAGAGAPPLSKKADEIARGRSRRFAKKAQRRRKNPSRRITPRVARAATPPARRFTRTPRWTISTRRRRWRATWTR